MERDGGSDWQVSLIRQEYLPNPVPLYKTSNSLTVLTLYYPSFSLQENFLSPGFYSETIYEKRLFDLPKLLDLCVIYGGENQELLGKMVANLFRRQPKLEEDWRTMVDSVLMEMAAVADRITARDMELLRLGQKLR